jgi:DNA-binding Xre family transcriptional regulator
MDLALVHPSRKICPLYDRQYSALNGFISVRVPSALATQRGVHRSDETIVAVRLADRISIGTDEQLERIAKIPNRELMRTGINQHKLEKICMREPVRAIRLATCLKVCEEAHGEIVDLLQPVRRRGSRMAVVRGHHSKKFP